jgi:hypothetical protein
LTAESVNDDRGCIEQHASSQAAGGCRALWRGYYEDESFAPGAVGRGGVQALGGVAVVRNASDKFRAVRAHLAAESQADIKGLPSIQGAAAAVGTARGRGSTDRASAPSRWPISSCSCSREARRRSTTVLHQFAQIPSRGSELDVEGCWPPLHPSVRAAAAVLAVCPSPVLAWS